MGGRMWFRRGARRGPEAATQKVERLHLSTAGDHIVEAPHWVIGARSGFEAVCACGWKTSLHDTQTAAKRQAFEHTIRSSRRVV